MPSQPDHGLAPLGEGEAMRTYRTQLSPPIAVGSELVVSIEVYYDPHLRLWTALADNEVGFQVGPAVYAFDRVGAIAECIADTHLLAADRRTR